MELSVLRSVVSDDDHADFHTIVKVLHSQGIQQVIDLAVLDEEDVQMLLGHEDALHQLGLKLRQKSVGYKHGWAKLASLEVRNSARPNSKLEPHHTPPAAPKNTISKTSTKILRRAMTSFTKRVILGAGVKRTRPALRAKSLLTRRDKEMESALKKIHGVFATYAQESPRFMALLAGPSAMMDMQQQSYRMGSRSARVVAQRARDAESFFLDIEAFRWQVPSMSPFQVATWVRSRCVAGKKTAASRAAGTLRVIQWATDWGLHLESPLVQSQVKPSACASDMMQKPKTAVTPSVDVVMNLESLVTSALTPQLRCLAFFCLFFFLFLCLAFGSSRSGDTQASMCLSLTKDAITGRAFMKNKKVWTTWFCSREGLCGDWAEPWLAELAKEGLPGPDFLLWAPNTSYDGWLQRPAEYHDLRRGLHFLLHNCLAMSVQDSVVYNPHSFCNFLIESGQQLRALKVCSTDDMERLGRWAKGSSMPDTYDNASGVSELMARHTVLNALRSGWRPVPEGNLPNRVSQCASLSGKVAPTQVAHIGTRMIHIKDASSNKTVCRMWTCGSPDCPAKRAQFADLPSHWARCTPCGA